MCKSGHVGRHCQTLVDPCKEVKCLNSGTCKTVGNGFICECVTGYHGEMCELKRNPCESNPCFNNGVCKNYVSSFLCICTEHFQGDLCDIDKRKLTTKTSSHLNGPHLNDEQRVNSDVIDDVITQKPLASSATSYLRITELYMYSLLLFLVVDFNK